LLADNRQRLAGDSIALLDKPLTQLRRQARQEVRQAAAAYLTAAGEPVPPGGDAPLLLAGHQPELAHPGVWIKHFALAGLARRHGLVPVNLIVDNDTAKSAAVRLPARDPETANVYLGSVPFDQMTAQAPYEERPVRDESLFAGFADRADALLGPWGYAPLLPVFWEEVMRQVKRTPLLGERFAAARRSFERRWGCHNFELPVSGLCRTETFAWFACHLLADIAGFHRVHNAALLEHRATHGIRSKNHPVPELAREDTWYETPFWAWRTGQERRSRLFARITQAGIELRAGEEHWPRLPVGTSGATVTAFRALEARGLKVRTRALTTTLFARLVAGELFIHGIGGGKYDELTDAIMRRYFGIEPPAFVVLSGTLHLPLPTFPDAETVRHYLHRVLRKLHYTPDSALAWRDTPDTDRLIAEKQRWINREPANRQERRERFAQIRALNEQMRPYVAEVQARNRRDLEKAESQVQANAIMQRRDYAFCLFPEAKIRSFCTQFLVELPPAERK
jgi:hypothetical protein